MQQAKLQQIENYGRALSSLCNAIAFLTARIEKCNEFWKMAAEPF
jgi:hypothetical protein